MTVETWDEEHRGRGKGPRIDGKRLLEAARPPFDPSAQALQNCVRIMCDSSVKFIMVCSGSFGGQPIPWPRSLFVFMSWLSWGHKYYNSGQAFECLPIYRFFVAFAHSESISFLLNHFLRSSVILYSDLHIYRNHFKGFHPFISGLHIYRNHFKGGPQQRSPSWGPQQRSPSLGPQQRSPWRGTLSCQAFSL